MAEEPVRFTVTGFAASACTPTNNSASGRAAAIHLVRFIIFSSWRKMRSYGEHPRLKDSSAAQPHAGNFSFLPVLRFLFPICRPPTQPGKELRDDATASR